MYTLVCVTFVVFTGCESCTRPISTNRDLWKEAGKYRLPRGTCFVARRLEVVAVAGLLWISWCVLGGADFFRFSFRFSFFERTRAAASVRPPCLYVSSTSTGVRTGCHYLICLSVRLSAVCMCNIRRFY